MEYKVQFIEAAGETHETFGTKYSVKFEEEVDTFELWYKKNTPAVGDTVKGAISNGRFKKEKPVFDGGTSSGQSYKKPYGAVEKDKQDGMRQGMCFNNASNFVNTTAPKTISSEDWANKVHEYAQALYSKGDLNVDESVQKAQEMFNK